MPIKPQSTATPNVGWNLTKFDSCVKSAKGEVLLAGLPTGF